MYKRLQGITRPLSVAPTEFSHTARGNRSLVSTSSGKKRGRVLIRARFRSEGSEKRVFFGESCLSERDIDDGHVYLRM